MSYSPPASPRNTGTVQHDQPSRVLSDLLKEARLCIGRNWKYAPYVIPSALALWNYPIWTLGGVIAGRITAQFVQNKKEIAEKMFKPVDTLKIIATNRDIPIGKSVAAAIGLYVFPSITPCLVGAAVGLATGCDVSKPREKDPHAHHGPIVQGSMNCQNW